MLLLKIVIFGIAISHHLLEIVINENRMLSRKHIHFKYSLPNVCESNENLSLKNWCDNNSTDMYDDICFFNNFPDIYKKF